MANWTYSGTQCPNAACEQVINWGIEEMCWEAVQAAWRTGMHVTAIAIEHGRSRSAPRKFVKAVSQLRNLTRHNRAIEWQQLSGTHSPTFIYPMSQRGAL